MSRFQRLLCLLLIVGSVAAVVTGLWQQYFVGITASAVLLVAGVVAWRSRLLAASTAVALLLLAASSVGAALCLQQVHQHAGDASAALWMLLFGCWVAAWLGVELLCRVRWRSSAMDWLVRIAVPVLFGAWLLILWEMLTVGLGIPQVLLPSPSRIAARFASSTTTLWADFRQTFLKAVLIGYALGCSAGFIVAILIDRSPFLQRGLLPVGNMVSALPIVGIAPIMVMWFGFDWPSKAAVVVVMTFFPMLVNTVTGLAEATAMQRDLMKTYAAGYWQSLVKLRLPMAMPFIFNALKINSTLSLIGAIVAEFFGTPIVGMGFRISTEVGRMNVDMVWAEIAVAACAGSLFYGLLALLERLVTFWHPSMRSR